MKKKKRNRIQDCNWKRGEKEENNRDDDDEVNE